MTALRIALRYLFSRKSHSAVNVISLISLGGVAVATAVIVCVLSVFNGFTDVAAAKLSSLSPDLRVEAAEGKTIADADSLSRLISGIDGVDIASPTVEEHALAIYGAHQVPVMMKGVTDSYSRLTAIDSLVKEDGIFMTHDERLGNFITLSVGTAIQLEARPGPYNTVKLYVPRRTGRINPANPMASFRGDSLAVSGVFQTEQAEYDTDMVLVPLDVARELLDYSTEASAVEIKTASHRSPGEVAADVRRVLGDGYIVKDRIGQQAQSFHMIAVEKWITFFLLAFVLIIASFNIISTLSMLIIEKQDNMATLRALGATPGMIRRIFIIEGWLIAAVGGVAGIIIGAAACLAQQIGGFIKLGGNHEAMSITVYPVRVEVTDMLAVLLLVILIGWLTSTLTTVRSSAK